MALHNTVGYVAMWYWLFVCKVQARLSSTPMSFFGIQHSTETKSKYQNMQVGQISNTRTREIFIFEVKTKANIERFILLHHIRTFSYLFYLKWPYYFKLLQTFPRNEICTNLN